MYYISVTFDCNRKNVVLLSSTSWSRLEELTDRLENYTDYTVFSVDPYGKYTKREMRKEFKGQNIVLEHKVEKEEDKNLLVKNIYNILWDKNKEN